MDIAAIGSAVTSLRVAGEIAKGLISLNTMAEVQSKAIELNSKLIQAQHDIFAANAEQSVLIERVRELEGEIVRMKNWETEKQRYKLAAPFAGCMVFALQKDMSNGQPAHYLCAACFQAGQPSILQGKQAQFTKTGRTAGGFFCPICKSSAEHRHNGSVALQYLEDIQPES